MVTLKLVSSQNNGQWRVSPNKQLGIPSCIATTPEVIAGLHAAFPQQINYDATYQAPLSDVRVELPTRAGDWIRLRQYFPVEVKEIGILFTPQPTTELPNPDQSRLDYWKEVWAPVLVDGKTTEVEYDGRTMFTTKVRVEVPERSWTASVRGNTLIRPTLQCYLPETYGDRELTWMGGNQLDPQPCFGELSTIVNEQGVTTVKQIDDLFFSSAFSTHLQVSWRWSSMGNLPNFSLIEPANLLHNGLYAVAKESLIHVR